MPATKKDIPVLFKFIKDLAEHHGTSEQLTGTEKLLDIALFGQKVFAEAIIAYFNHKPVVYALFSHNFSTLLCKPGLYIIDLYVIPTMRNQGLGKKMLGYLASLAKERQCGRLEWSVLCSNVPAIKLYENIGAKRMDDWKTYRITGDALDKLAIEINQNI